MIISIFIVFKVLLIQHLSYLMEGFTGYQKSVSQVILLFITCDYNSITISKIFAIVGFL